MVEVHYAAVQAVDRRHYGDEVLAAWSPPPDSRRRDWLADLIGQASTLCTVAVADDGAIVGFSIALPEQALLKALYVHPDCNGRGIGQALLEDMEARCRALGVEVLALNASHNAEAFYRHCGYEPQGATRQPLTETVTMAATRMVKRLAGVAGSINLASPPATGLSGAMPGSDVALASFDLRRDRELVTRWLDHPQVARWWGEPRRALAELLEHDADTVALIVVDGRSVGLLCWQVPTWEELRAAGLDDLPPDLVDVDIMIGEAEALGRGIGPAALERLFARLRDEGVRTVGLATARVNTRSLRACEKAGLQPYRDFVEGGECYRYLVRDLQAS